MLLNASVPTGENSPPTAASNPAVRLLSMHAATVITVTSAPRYGSLIFQFAFITGLLALAWPDQVAEPSGWVKLLVLARNAAAVGVVLSWFAATGAPSRTERDGSRVSA